MKLLKYLKKCALDLLRFATSTVRCLPLIKFEVNVEAHGVSQ